MALTDNWNIVSGDWTIVNGRLHEPGTTDAKIISLHPVPADSAGEMHVSVDMCDPIAGNEYYIYLACDDVNGNGGVWVRFTYNGSNNWTVLLSTGETKDMTFAPVGGATIWQGEACVDSDGTMYGRVQSSGSEYPWTADAGTQNGRYHGLGHGAAATNSIYFDNYAVHELRRGDVFCYECFCHCDVNNVKKELCLTITNASERAFYMGGESVTMTWEWNAGTPRWVSEVLNVPSRTAGSTASSNFKWNLLCTGWDVDNPMDNFGLEWDDSYEQCCTHNSGGCDAIHLPIDASSTCEPLKLVFGPFTLSVGEFSCNACWDANDPDVSAIPPEGPPWDPPLTGNYYIEISEGACSP